MQQAAIDSWARMYNQTERTGGVESTWHKLLLKGRSFSEFLVESKETTRKGTLTTKHGQ